ncbi:MAG: methionine--tRNA ligase subunit beta [Patescibacteria group bacterium]
MISYDDFKKVDIRVGKILSVEEVPETDKLLKLSVDFGEGDVRQIVSGIKLKVEDPQALVGKKTTFVVNLEPRMIKGFESNGMLFAAGGDEHFSFLVPEKDIPEGSRTN